ncbi:MAG: phosphorylase [Desulfuromonadales bacterium]|nr:MAG: phosphorylase [Desulfuromonadales bacterium]
MTTIGLMAAMPDETRSLLRLAGPATRKQSGRFVAWRFLLGGVDVCLMESGMGMERAEAAAEELCAVAAPAVIISFGFGGGARPGLHVGDLVVGTESWLYGANGLTFRNGINRKLAGRISAGLFSTVGAVTNGEIITSSRILNKRQLATSLPLEMTAPVLDMETAAVADVASRHGIPLVALRAISDNADEELSFSLDEFIDQDMTISPLKVLATIVRKPWIIPQLIRLARSSRIAGERLAHALTTVVGLLGDSGIISVD